MINRLKFQVFFIVLGLIAPAVSAAELTTVDILNCYADNKDRMINIGWGEQVRMFTDEFNSRVLEYTHDLDYMANMVKTSVNSCREEANGQPLITRLPQFPNQDDIVALLQCGSLTTFRTSGGFTLLHGAAFRSLFHNVQILLQYGADKTALDDDGRTPFDIVGMGNSQSPEYDTVRSLLVIEENRLDENQEDNE